ncbi:hypothetical protein [Dolichospermum circinale]|uniref:hypothetical protein n=1 Tax=Dolichospermum circinale TaxID=109265 RepID=UPI0005561D50|nr:hypothetical protein [Dolichospermum circinale]MDB9484705.1 hypothetical protein [Dolichospermum circinale CS-537/05]MDB9453039.1 hypothetical protein [Dolichospermum circinale CS-541/06]MDB9464926.1 hypothetical protein [Dolichospermum circinale CS-541/04]MDB9476409.1 hypothetical protein [Dolichospermum circinale CS-537/11]MDB9480136.1 hypothetical protein [Dolichospermum circinale CS-537/03]
MFLPRNRGRLNIFSIFTRHKSKIKYLLLLVLSSLIVAENTQVLAHTVKISADVGGTVHLEPNDSPRAGEVTPAWFLLTRKGGQVIPLKDCHCQLAIYAEPHVTGEPALIQPLLKPIQAERYQGIPGGEFIFPKPGAYQLQLSGTPVTAGSFLPFELKFLVTVARGKVVNTPQGVQNGISQEGRTIGLTQPLIWLGILLISGGIVIFLVSLCC